MLIGRQFGDEVVLANYENGLYYSMVDNAAQIWLALKAGLPDDEIIGAFGAQYAAADPKVETQISDFIARLAAEGIIVPVEQAAQRQPWDLVAASHFEPPVLERYDDLRDLLLLDPVHDVDDRGWPVRADDAG